MRTVAVEAVGMWATGAFSRCPHTHSPGTPWLGQSNFFAFGAHTQL
jgi:hypothetical protein